MSLDPLLGGFFFTSGRAHEGEITKRLVSAMCAGNADSALCISCCHTFVGTPGRKANSARDTLADLNVIY